MDLNKLILESISTIIEGKDEVGIRYSNSKESSIKDINVGDKEEASIEKALNNDISKEHKNSQDKGEKAALADIQKNPKLGSVIVAGIA